MYALGGFNGVPATVATADKIDMSTYADTAITTANLTTVRGEVTGVSNPSTAGYIGGGTTAVSLIGNCVTTTDKLTFSNDTTAAATTANLSLARAQAGPISQRTTKAYYGGGISGTTSASCRVVTTDVLTFSGDSTSAVTTANLSQGRNVDAGLTGEGTKGYWCGGATGPTSGTVLVKTGDKIIFSGDSTSAVTTANLSTARNASVCGSDGSTKGYYLGGSTGTSVNTIDKLTFSTDTIAALTSTITQAIAAAAPGCDGNQIVWAGGVIPAGTDVATIRKFTIATETDAATGTSLTAARQLVAGVSTVGL